MSSTHAQTKLLVIRLIPTIQLYNGTQLVTKFIAIRLIPLLLYNGTLLVGASVSEPPSSDANGTFFYTSKRRTLLGASLSKQLTCT